MHWYMLVLVCFVCIVHVHRRAYDKWLDEKAEEADTVSKQLAVLSAVRAVSSMHAASLLHSISHKSMLTHSLKNAKLDMMLHAPATQGRQGEADYVTRALPPIKIA